MNDGTSLRWFFIAQIASQLLKHSFRDGIAGPTKSRTLQFYLQKSQEFNHYFNKIASFIYHFFVQFESIQVR